MMVAIHEAGQDDLLVRAEHRIRLVLRRQFLIGTDGDDRAIALKYGTVFDHVRFAAANHFTNHVLAVNQGRRHRLLLLVDLRRVSSIFTSSCSWSAIVTSARRRSTN